MDDKTDPKFEVDDYIEHLLTLRDSDPITYGVYPEATRNVVDTYERERNSVQE